MIKTSSGIFMGSLQPQSSSSLKKNSQKWERLFLNPSMDVIMDPIWPVALAAKHLHLAEASSWLGG